MSTTLIPPCPEDLAAKMESGEPFSREDLRRLIAWEASLIGLTIHEATRRWLADRSDGLGHGPIATDVGLLLGMLLDPVTPQ